MKKNKICPYRKHCRYGCYGENPCHIAKAFDGLLKKIEGIKEQNRKLQGENECLRERVEWLEAEDCV